MGREVKRVALEFDWPMNVVWKGYCNPFNPTKCTACEGTGVNAATRALQNEWFYGDWQHNLEQMEVDALWEENRLWDFDSKPTADAVNTWSRRGLGHDALNRMICIESRGKREGTYGFCPVCDGHGNYFASDDYREAYEHWEGIDPPKGPGFQMWETTSEGSPISPVFETPEELAHWLADNSASSFGDRTCTYEEWLNFIKGSGWAVSAVGTKSGLVSGVEACGQSND
jgi:hypothetical protein